MAVGLGVSESGNPNIPATASCAISATPGHVTLPRVKTYPCKPPAPLPGVPGRGELMGQSLTHPLEELRRMECNPIERVWRHLHDEITRDHGCQTRQDKGLRRTCLRQTGR